MNSTRHMLVPAEPIRKRLLWLHDEQKMSWRAISAASGVSVSAVRYIAVGRAFGSHKDPVLPEHTELWVCKALHSVDPLDKRNAVGLVSVDATGTRRRVQALMRRGWSIPLICADSGLERQTLERVLRGADRVRAETMRAIKETYEHLWDASPPNETPHQRASVVRNINRAVDAGWLTPMEWDDDYIDDPTYTPEPVTNSENVDYDEFYFLVESGVPRKEAAQRVGVSLAQIAERLERIMAEVPGGLAQRMSERDKCGLNPYDVLDMGGTEYVAE